MFTGPIQLAAQEVFKQSTTKLHKLGAQGVTRDGRIFRYSLIGGTNVAAGKLNGSAAVVANHQNIAVATAAAVGDAQVNVTLGATASTANQYDDGYLIGYDVAGTGQTLQILATPILGSAGTGYFPLQDSVITALTTSSKVNLEQNPWSNVVITTTSQTAFVCGVANAAFTAGTYAWLQTRGTASVLGNGTISQGAGLVASATTGGAVDAEAATAVGQRLGFAQQAGASTKYNTVYLAID